MAHILTRTRYLILIPIVGLALAAAFFFVFGGIRLLTLIVEMAFTSPDAVTHSAEAGPGMVIFEVVEYVHTFLVGTVLYITAVGLYQLFIHEIDFPAWLKVENTEELETNLIGVTVVVLAVNFMGATFVGGTEHLLQYGVGIALPIAALGLFVGLRAWSLRISRETDAANAEDTKDAARSAKE